MIRERSRKTVMPSDHWSNKDFIVDLIGEFAGIMRVIPGLNENENQMGHEGVRD